MDLFVLNEMLLVNLFLFFFFLIFFCLSRFHLSPEGGVLRMGSIKRKGRCTKSRVSWLSNCIIIRNQQFCRATRNYPNPRISLKS